MTQKSLFPILKPILITMVLGISLNFADTWFMSTISDDAAGAIGSLFPVIMIYMMVLSGLAQGGVNVGSQYRGADNPDYMRRCFSASYWLLLFTGVVISVAFTFSIEPMARVLGIDEAGVVYVSQYFSIIAPFVWIRALYHVYSVIFNAVEKGKYNSRLALFINLLNIGLNALFIEGVFGTHWQGVNGLALATLISQIINVIVMVYLMHIKLKFKFPFKHFLELKDKILYPIIRIAGPSTIEPLAFQISQFIYAAFYIQLGNVAMSTRIYTVNLLIWCILWSLALGQANQILVAEYVGAKNYEGAIAQMKKSYKMGILGAFIILIPLNIFSDQIYGVFTENKEIFVLGSTLMMISFILEAGRSLNLVVGGILRATGDSLWTTVMSIGVIYILIVPLAYYLTIETPLGLVGLWIAMSSDEWIRGLANLTRWNSGKWRVKGIH